MSAFSHRTNDNKKWRLSKHLFFFSSFTMHTNGTTFVVHSLFFSKYSVFFLRCTKISTVQVILFFSLLLEFIGALSIWDELKCKLDWPKKKNQNNQILHQKWNKKSTFYIVGTGNSLTFTAYESVPSSVSSRTFITFVICSSIVRCVHKIRSFPLSFPFSLYAKCK